MGPGGGDAGGRIVASGTPQEIRENRPASRGGISDRVSPSSGAPDRKCTDQIAAPVEKTVELCYTLFIFVQKQGDFFEDQCPFLLEASVERVPDRVCWADAASALTYREAWTAVCNMGAALSERLSAVNAPVCVCFAMT